MAESHVKGPFTTVVACPLVNGAVATGGLDVEADPKSKASSKDSLNIGFGLSLIVVSGIVCFPPKAASSSAVLAGRLASPNVGNRAAGSGGSLKVVEGLEAGEPRLFFADGGGGKAENGDVAGATKGIPAGTAGAVGSLNPKVLSKGALETGPAECSDV